MCEGHMVLPETDVFFIFALVLLLVLPIKCACVPTLKLFLCTLLCGEYFSCFCACVANGYSSLCLCG